VIKETDADGVDNNAESDGYKLLLNKVTVNNASIHYEDKVSNILFYMKGLNSSLKGKLSDERANLNLIVNSEDVTILYDEIAYLQQADLRFNAAIDANLKDKIYNLKNNVLYINGLQINFEGSVAEVDNDLNYMLVYNTPDNSFKQLLSLIPVIYKEGYEDMVTKGKFNIDGYIKGVYSESDIPDFKLQMQASNTEISYPNMSSSINNIEFDFLVENKGNDLDNALIRIDKFSGNLGTDKVSASLQLLHPVSDPFIDLKAIADIKFENLSNVFPQESIRELTGDLKADFNLKGNLSAIEKQDYKNFRAMGSMVCDHIRYQMDESYAFALHHAQFNFSPAQIDIIGFSSDINNNALEVDGKLSNYLNYLLKDEKFMANLNLRSQAIDVNQLLEPWSSGTVNRDGQSEEGVTYIPENIDILVNVAADSLSYGQLLFTDFNSKVHIYDGKIEFEDMASAFLGGLVNVTGYYEATSSVSPHIDLEIALKDVMVSNAYQGMSLFRKFTPIAEKASGVFDLSVNLDMELDNNLDPIWSSILGNGSFTSDDIELKANKVFSEISDVLKVDLFENPSTGPIDLSFKMMDGKIFHKPFDISLENILMEVGGWTSFDQQIDYNMVLNLPLSVLGNNASDKLTQFGDEYGLNIEDIKNIRPVFKVKGFASDPKVELVSFENLAGNNIKNIVEDKVEEVVNEYLEEANKEADRILAEAQADADSIIADAQKKADQVMNLARQAVDDTKKEARKQADRLVQEAAKNGPLAELAAKKAAEELMKTADKEADQALSKAQNEADKIMEGARVQAEGIMQRALEKADKIRE
jgi:vacuolar-type H+-ATPase subunit H